MDEVDDSIKSGMMADVAIVTEQARDVLYVPQQALTFAEDGLTRIVQKRMADGSYIDVPVQVGLRSGSDVQVTSDQLKEGDEVKLTKVTSMMGNNNNSIFGFSINGMGGAPGGAMGGGAPGGGPGGGGGGRRPPQ